MSRSGFKRYEFFDVDTISNDVVATLGSMPTAAIAEGGMLLFGDKYGHLIMCERNFQSAEKKHKLFRGEIKGIAFLYDPINIAKQYVIVLGDDAQPQYSETSSEKHQPLYFVKIYAASDFVRPLHVLNATHNDSVATSFAVLHDGQQIAVGYESGSVILFAGKYLQEVSSTPIRNAAFTTLLTSHAYPVTSLHFCEVPSKRGVTDRRVRLFAVFDVPDAPVMDLSQDRAGEQGTVFTRPPDPGLNGEDPKYAGVLIFDTSLITGGPGGADLSTQPRHSVRVLDERGAPAHCSTFMRGQSELVVARSEAVYNYSVEDKGGALAIAGDKLCISAVGRYTLVVSVEERTAVPVVAAGISSADGELPTYLKPKRPMVNIYDLKNKILCGTAKKYQLPLSDRVLFTMADGGVVYLLTTSGQIIRFREKDTHRKLDMLLTQSQPPLYSMAIVLAAEEQLEPAEIMKLYKQYGDHLYEEKDFDGAIVQYSHTIGYIPSSTVITKFLDPYRIANLIAYLEKLHAKGLAGSDHITLLLSCYTKVKDETQINALLDAIAVNPHIKGAQSKHTTLKNTNVAIDSTGNFSQFNPEQAIAILDAAGYTAHALKLAARYLQHSAYVDIQMKKSPPLYDDVLGYLAYLPFVASLEEILALLRQHGRTLARHRAAVFCTLLIKLCTGDYLSLLPANHPAVKAGTASGGPNTPLSGSTSAKESAGSTKAGPRNSAGISAGGNKTATVEVLKSFAHLVAADVTVPTERLSITEVTYLFSSDQDSLLALLEGFVAVSAGRTLPPKVTMTLVEMYMARYADLAHQIHVLKHSNTQGQGATSTPSLASLEASQQSTETQIMNLLDGAHAQYDPAHALLLCHSFGFDRGQRFLLERQQSTELLMRLLIEGNDVREVFKVLRREGSKNPDLYVQVLTYFVQQSIVADHEGDGEGKAGTGKGTRRRGSDGSEGEGGSEDDDSDSEEASSEDDEERWNSIMDVMDLIEKEAVLAPLQVLSILALNPRLPLHVAANYMSSTLKTLSESAEAVKASVRSAMTDIEAVSASKSNLNQLTARQIRQQERVARKEAQRAAANVHRIGIGANVRNSLHDDDLDDEEEEDEETEEQERAHRAKREEYWHNLRNSMIECSTNHEAFFKKLAHNPDGFGVIVEHFGRSIIV